MQAWMIAQQNAPLSADWTGWLMGAIAVLSTVISGMAVWYVKVREPQFSDKIQAIVMDSAHMLVAERADFNKRMDAREASWLEALTKANLMHAEELKIQRSECRGEREQRDTALQADLDRLDRTFGELTLAIKSMVKPTRGG